MDINLKLGAVTPLQLAENSTPGVWKFFFYMPKNFYNIL